MFHTLSFAQDKNIEKDTVYTLKDDEVVAYEENSLGMYQSQTGYLVVTANKPSSHNYQRFYHVKDGTFGPYNRKKIDKPAFNQYIWGFIDGQNKESDVVINGKIIKHYGESKYPLGLKTAGTSWVYVVYLIKEGTFEIIHNRKSLGKFDNIIDYKLSESGELLAILYTNPEKKQFLQLSNGQVFGPYDKIYDFHFLGKSGNWWVMTVDKNNPENEFTVITQAREIGTFALLQGRGSPPSKPILKTYGYNYGISVLIDGSIYYLANDILYGPYKEVPENINMGYDFNRFNYILGEEKEFYFKGEGGYTNNVRNYFVSDTRKSVALIKPAQNRKDSLVINEKDFKGLYDEIFEVGFEPEGENWILLSKEASNRFSLHSENGENFSFFSVDNKRFKPVLLVGPKAKYWAVAYWNNITGKPKLYINSKDKSEGFLGNLKLVKKGKDYYFTWFAQEGNTVFFYQMLLN